MRNNVPEGPGTFDDVSAIPTLLQTLRATPPPDDGVLSVYLDTSLQRVEGQAYVLSFREGCRQLRAALETAERAQQKALEAAVAQAESYVTERFVPRHPGLALFASGQAGYLYAVPLPQRPAEDFTWAAAPLLSPLEGALDDYERVAVALVDKRRTRLFTVFLGSLEAHEAFESDVPGKQATGEWGGVAERDYTRQHGRRRAQGVSRAPRGGGMAAARYARHHEDHVLRHVRRTTRALTALMRRYPFDRLLLAGPEEALTFLRDDLPRPLRARFAGTLPLATEASEAEVLRAAVEAAEAIERRTEVELVDALIEAESTPRAVLGLEATLAALSEDRVFHLVIGDRFAAIGSECEQCGRLLAGVGPCPSCGGSTAPVVDLRERVIERALEQGARVETVAGEAAALLATRNSLAAWTRY